MARYHTGRDSRVGFGVSFNVNTGALGLGCLLGLTGKNSVEELLTGTAPTIGELVGDGVEDRLFEFKPYVLPSYPSRQPQVEDAFNTNVWGKPLNNETKKEWQY